MAGDLRKRRGNSRALIIAFACLALIAGGCSDSKPDKAEKADSGVLDTSRLPRVAGAKDIFASPATTIFISPAPIGPTIDTVDKALAAAGWQKYVAPNTAYREDPTSRSMTLKRGQQALSVYIAVAPAQNNAITVQYTAIPLKTDLPFTKDASNIEYSPERALLTLVTAEPVDKTLDFYRKEMAERGWLLWSEKTNGKQPPGGPSGTMHERGGYAHYITDKDPAVTLVLTLQKADAGKLKVEIKQWPAGVLEAAHRAYLNRDNSAPLVEVAKLPRLPGASETERSSAERVVYSVAGNLPTTAAALKTLLAGDGWKPYAVPLEQPSATSLNLKKGQQGLSVSFTISVGSTEETTDQTTVYYTPTRLQFAPPFPDDATDIVFDEHRPYLSLVAGGTVESLRDFYGKQLLAAEWSQLTPADAAAKWPNAKFDDKPANGDVAYYVRGADRAIILTLHARDGGKVDVEIKVPPFALPQTLEADNATFGLPVPKLHKSAGSRGGQSKREVYAHVPASVDTVLAFYRRELAARGWKEEPGAKVTPSMIELAYTTPDGSATLKIGHQYDLTTVNLMQQVTQPAAKVETPTTNERVDAVMKEMQQMIRESTAAAAKPQKTAQADTMETLHPRAGGEVPVPLPDNAADVEFEGGDGKLEFNSPSSVKSVAEFYRTIMKQQGWQSRSSVINNANMVELNFAKGGKTLTFTIMKMGNQTNVSADGSALQVAAAKSTPAKGPTANTPTQPASAEDLEAEESGGLPVPKRHTMTLGTKTPFRRELSANVPLDLASVLGFYRRELGKLNWKEESKGATIAADRATVAFVSPEGPAVLRLGRKDNETTVSLAVKNPEAAKTAGILPKPGRARVMFGNILPADSALTFNNQTIKVAAGAGTKAPDGPMLDLAPGKYKYSIKSSGGAPKSDEVELRADETWGLMIGPGGVLPLQAY